MANAVSTPTVLIVDDDPSLRLLCRVNLELDGYRVVEARDLGEAEGALGAGDVDVVLLDVHVGSESGLDLLRSLRTQAGSPPVILFTGSAKLDDATKAEADGVVAKPFRLEELLGVVRRLVG
jgi:DNA-binding response OmpR family regulator